ncbi:hypothetical protein [Jiangella endophytica]|nr:hypothetical protein [Jiangella endophytica]
MSATFNDHFLFSHINFLIGHSARMCGPFGGVAATRQGSIVVGVRL